MSRVRDIRKTKFKDIFIILLLLLLINAVTTRADEPVYSPLCTGSSYTSNSPFETNLKLLLSSLPLNTSVSGGFYNASIGMPADVYGLALCRGDLTREECLNCVDNGSKRIIEACPNSLSAAIFYEVCHVRYSDENFFSKMVYAAKYATRGIISNSNNTASNNWNNTKQNIVDSEIYSRVLGNLMTEIVSEASDASGKMFVTKEAKLDDTGSKLYGLGQCTEDLSKVDCHGCLTQARGDIAVNDGNEGGFVVDNSCNLRYELYRFYRVQPPPGKKRRAIIITVSLLAVLIFVVLGSWAYCRYGKSKRGNCTKTPAIEECTK
ncbi:hypothetical protein MKW92_003210 [Papaver armeniacum]|nr:hypothetical protein MKW92_003210 [Papaver armeniacum]